MTLAAEEAGDPPPHSTLPTDYQRPQRVALVHRVTVDGLFLDGLADEKGGQVSPQTFVQPEEPACFGKPLINIRFHLEVP